ncbi:MAG: hypothetical protein ABIQ35_14520 [Verrucomicrobiota bacterium]
MNRIFLSTTLTLAAVSPLSLRAADSLENPNRFSFGPRFGMNFKAAFHNRPAANPGNSASDPGAATGGVDHTYDDGYVLIDSSGNAGGVTWNWGYQNASQVAGDTMQFHARQANASGASNQKGTDDPQYGGEFTYQRVLGLLPLPSARWGLEAAFGFTDLDLRSQQRGAGSSTLTTDTFSLNGVLPPGAGYNGTFAGPGALLGDVPTRSVRAGTLTTRQKLSGQVYGLRFGPFAEWNFTPEFSLSASVGLSLVPASIDYDFSESASITGGAISSTRGHSSKTELLYGPYVSAMLRYDFSEHWGVFIGAQFQSLNDLKQSSGTHSARLDQGATVFATVGASWRF